MLEQQAPAEQMNRFEALCAEIEEYDHIPEMTSSHPMRMLTGSDHEAELDAEILAGLVSP